MNEITAPSGEINPGPPRKAVIVESGPNMQTRVGTRFDVPGQIFDINDPEFRSQGLAGIGTRPGYPGDIRGRVAFQTTDGNNPDVPPSRYVLQSGCIINVDESIRLGHLRYDVINEVPPLSITDGMTRDQNAGLLTGQRGTNLKADGITAITIDPGSTLTQLAVPNQGDNLQTDSMFVQIDADLRNAGLEIDQSLAEYFGTGEPTFA